MGRNAKTECFPGGCNFRKDKNLVFPEPLVETEMSEVRVLSPRPLFLQVTDSRRCPFLFAPVEGLLLKEDDCLGC